MPTSKRNIDSEPSWVRVALRSNKWLEAQYLSSPKTAELISNASPKLLKVLRDEFIQDFIARGEWSLAQDEEGKVFLKKPVAPRLHRSVSAPVLGGRPGFWARVRETFSPKAATSPPRAMGR